jgi:hypothetical protein
MFESTVRRYLALLAEERLISRFWNKDLSLWPRYPDRRAPNPLAMNWLDLPDNLPASMGRVNSLAEKLIAAGFQHGVFVAISSSGNAAELLPALGLPARGFSFRVQNHIDPASIRILESELDLRRTVFLVASKTGKNLEMHALLLCCLARLKSVGVANPGAQFVAITEDGSYLATLASENKFLAVFEEPHGFRGRFSGVQHYGLLLGGLCGFDSAKILAAIEASRQECRRTSPIEQNPAANFAAFLAALVATGHRRLVIRSSEKLLPLAKRLAHLVGCSSCKGESGILPFLEVQVNPEILAKGGIGVCNVVMAGESVPAPLDPGFPTVTTEVPDLESLPAQVFEWEVATALACSLLDVNPFDDPDYIDGRDESMRLIEQFSVQKDFGVPRPRIAQGDVALFVDGGMRHELSGLSIEHALSSLFSLCAPDGYCSLLSFLWHKPEVKQILIEISEGIGRVLGVPTTILPGPRYIHLAGQYLKAGPNGGIALLLTCDTIDKLEVPGAEYSLGDLRLALALGDYDAMNRRGRPIVRLHLSADWEKSIAELRSILEKAVNLHRRAH